MANPQPEQGTTRINQEVLESLLAYPFTSPFELKICLFVMRKTWGYSKKKDRISITQFQKGIKASRPTVVHWLNSLVKHLLLVKEVQPPGSVYGFNKDFDTWVVKPLKLVKPRAFASKPPLTETSKPPLTHKRKKKTTKEIRVFEKWNSLKIIKHGTFTKKMETRVEAALKEYNLEEIKKSMSKYGKVVGSPEYYWTYKWTLEEFLQRGLTKFLDKPIEDFKEKWNERDEKAMKKTDIYSNLPTT